MKRLLTSCILILSFCLTLAAQEVFINEIDYLGDDSRFIEIVAPSTINIDGYTLYFYDNNGYVYYTETLSNGLTAPNGECFSRYIFIDAIVTLSKEDNSGLALVDPYNNMLQYVTYGGTNIGQEGPAQSVMSENIGKQASDNETLQLTGEGSQYGDFTWDTPGEATPGAANHDQDVDCDAAQEEAKNLPVEWVSFTAEADKEGIKLEWITATEEDNQGFILERSKDGWRFSEIAMIEGNGSTTNGNRYQYYDEHATNGQNYYRIGQIDNDGLINYYRLINIRFNKEGQFDIYPNPAQDEVSIAFPSEETNVSIRIFDATGRLVKTMITAEAALSSNLNISDLQAGYYQVVVQTNLDTETMPLIIK